MQALGKLSQIPANTRRTGSSTALLQDDVVRFFGSLLENVLHSPQVKHFVVRIVKSGICVLLSYALLRCRHCIALEPEYTKAATELEREGLLLAKVRNQRVYIL